MLDFLHAAVFKARMNVIVSREERAAGKTTTFSTCLSSFICQVKERIVTIEDAAELVLRQQDHVVRARDRDLANIEGKGADFDPAESR